MNYIYFLVYLIVAISCLVVLPLAAIRRNNDAAAAAVITFFLCVIGIFTNLHEAFRVFSALYGIEWAG
jgi:hypothetical protein